ncbi:cupin domain-containing protein [Sodalis sp. dw_96]|uniref:cupin domain-containing protein n=1 Tax=Sodalis sp. dw_96 TaxID=2719794 RepID=UPI00210619C2|nr:cupin domain-containing protein [Sodalis sp. dw_96]
MSLLAPVMVITLPSNAPTYVLANDEHTTPEDGVAAFDWSQSDVARHEGDDTVLLAGSFSFEESDAALLLDSLPRFLLISAHIPSASVIRSTLEILDLEIRGTQIGAAVLTDRLADILLVQVLRSALDQVNGDNCGWISALADARMGKAIGMMHGNAAYPWDRGHSRPIDQMRKPAQMTLPGLAMPSIF